MRQGIRGLPLAALALACLGGATSAQAADGRNCVIDQLSAAEAQAVRTELLGLADQLEARRHQTVRAGPAMTLLLSRLGECRDRHGWSQDVMQLNFRYIAQLLGLDATVQASRIDARRKAMIERAVGAAITQAMARQPGQMTTSDDGRIEGQIHLNITDAQMRAAFVAAGLPFENMNAAERAFFHDYANRRVGVATMAMAFDQMPGDSIITNTRAESNRGVEQWRPR
jgi:hypothetical protein